MFDNLNNLIKELKKDGQEEIISLLMPILKDSPESRKDVEPALVALENLANNGNLLAKQCLVDELESSSWDVRKIATKILIDLINNEDIEIITLLTEFLKIADDWDARKNAIEILGHAGKRKEIFDALMNAISDENEFVAGQAILAIGTMSNEKAIPYILTELKSDSEHIKISAINALGKIWDETVIVPLNKIISGNVPDVLYKAAYKALTNIRLQSLDAFTSTDIDIKQKAIKILGLLGGEDVISYLLDALRDNDLKIQNSALTALENQKDIRVMEALQPLLKSDDESVRIKVIDILTKNFDITDKMSQLLIKALKDESSTIRHKALKELNKLKNYHFLPAIISAIDDEEETIRTFIAEILENYYDVQSVKALNKLLEDQSSIVHDEAEKYLNKIITTGKKDIEKKDKFKMLNAISILSQCNIDECYDILFDQLDTNDSEIRDRIIHCAKNMGERILDFLFDKLKTVSGKRKYYIVEILEAYNDEKTINNLIDLLKDKDPQIRARAINSLKNIGKPSLPVLFKALRAERVVIRRSAVYLTGEIGKTDVVHKLLPFLRDSNLSVIRAAVNIIKQIGDVYSISALVRLKKDDRTNIIGTLIDTAIIEVGNRACEHFNQTKQKIPIEAITILAKVQTPKIRDFFIPLLKDDNEIIQRIALDTLVNMPHSFLIPCFIELLDLKNNESGDLARDGLIKIAKESNEWKKEIRDNLISLISKKDKIFQARAIQILAKLKIKDTMEYVYSILMEADENLAVICVEMFYEFRSDSIPYLIKALSSPKWDVRSNAKRILARLGKVTVPNIVDILKQENEELRKEAEDVLYKIGEDGVNEFIKVFNNETNEIIREIIIGVLGTIEDKNSFLTIIKAMNDSNLKIRQKAISALKNFAEFVNNEMDTVSSYGFEQEETILKQQHEDFIYSLVVSLKDSDKVTAGIIAETLAKMGEITVTPLLELLLSKNDEGIKPSVISILGEVGSNKPLNQLLELLPDSQYQADIIKSLGKIGDKKAIRPLGELLNKTKDKNTKTAIIKALGDIKNIEALDYIADLIESSDTEIKTVLLNSLANIDCEKALNLILTALSDKNNEVQIVAYKALLKIKSPQIIPHLIFALKKELPVHVHIKIIETLGEIKGQEAIDILLEKLNTNLSPEIKTPCIKALGQIGETESVITDLLPLLKDNDIRVSYQTITTLGDLADPSTLEVLKPLTKKSGKTIKDWILCSSAQKSVERIRKKYSS